jgi:hypothetical protein
MMSSVCLIYDKRFLGYFLILWSSEYTLLCQSDTLATREKHLRSATDYGLTNSPTPADI